MTAITNKTFLNFIVLGGTMEEKIAATAAAGFDQAEVWREDVEAYEPGAKALGIRLRSAGLIPTDIMVLRDFAGAPVHLHQENVRKPSA
jgi:4-hydroxyphenylpyruvate dioxygenase